MRLGGECGSAVRVPVFFFCGGVRRFFVFFLKCFVLNVVVVAILCQPSVFSCGRLRYNVLRPVVVEEADIVRFCGP